MSDVTLTLAGRTIPKRAQSIGTTFEAIYTAPENITARAIVISLCNRSGSAGTFSVQHNDGSTATAIASQEAIGANSRVRVPLEGQILKAGETIEVLQSGPVALDATLMVIEAAN